MAEFEYIRDHDRTRVAFKMVDFLRNSDASKQTFRIHYYAALDFNVTTKTSWFLTERAYP